jgi:hypothetical protein
VIQITELRIRMPVWYWLVGKDQYQEVSLPAMLSRRKLAQFRQRVVRYVIETYFASFSIALTRFSSAAKRFSSVEFFVSSEAIWESLSCTSLYRP